MCIYYGKSIIEGLRAQNIAASGAINFFSCVPVPPFVTFWRTFANTDSINLSDKFVGENKVVWDQFPVVPACPRPLPSYVRNVRTA